MASTPSNRSQMTRSLRDGPLSRRSTTINMLAIGLLYLGLSNAPAATTRRETTGRSSQAAGPPSVDVVQEAVEPPTEPRWTPDSPTAPQPQPSDPSAGQPPPSDPCAEALAWVAEAGLRLPAQVGYHCPSTEFAHHGAACWSGFACPAGPFVAINLDLIAGRTTEYLRHVVAHEVCHELDFNSGRGTTEAGADACAAAHGAPA